MNQDRKKLKAQYQALYTEVESILFKHDLIGINFEYNTDEYDPEVGTILPRLKEANCKEDVASIIYEEFVRWFDEDIALDKENPAYIAMATEVWETWLKHINSIA
jgi:hypothetical protein